MSEITDRQRELLSDLLALERAGLISSGEQVLAHDGYDEGSTMVDVPGVVTFAGVKFLEGK